MAVSPIPELIVKRDGSEARFDQSKIEAAIAGANSDLPPGSATVPEEYIAPIASHVAHLAGSLGHVPSVEEVQDLVESELMRLYPEVGRAYITYRYTRQLARRANTTDDKVLSIIDYTNEEAKHENSNKDPLILSVQRDYMAGEVSKDLTFRVLLPKDVAEAHEAGIIHFHDSDYFAQHMMNCDLVNLDDMLQNGTVISKVKITKPHSFSTACNIATQVIAQVASCQYGGQTISLAHLVPFVEVSRQKFRRQVREELEAADLLADDCSVARMAEMRLADEVTKGIQTIQYQLVTLMTTNGQTPFVTVYMNLEECEEGQARDDMAMLCEETFKQRIKGIQNPDGSWVTPAFPKLVYVLDHGLNIDDDDPYFELTRLAAACTARRMVPDYISAPMMRRLKLSKGEREGEGDVYTCMGCRSFLTPDRSGDGWGNIANAGNHREGEPKYYGRFNQGVVTINLPDVALSSGGDFDKFWEIFDQRLELCHRALRCRHERLLGTKSDVAPILWQHGALARLAPGEKIDKLLYGGYSTISLGYAGLYECVRYMTGKSHTDPQGKPFAIAVMQRMNDKCNEWKAAEDIDYSIYGTPIESTTYKFAKCLQRRFGIVPGVTDKGYVTNSYHVHVTEEIDAFSKLAFESEFQALSPGGAISYVEVPDMTGNLEAVLSVMRFICDNIIYAELNTKSDHCQSCGYDGEIKVVTDEATGKLVWECPVCGERDEHRLNVARRTCGYIGSNFWNAGRTQEIAERVLHL